MNLPMISPPEKLYHFIKLIYLFKIPLKLFYFKGKKNLVQLHTLHKGKNNTHVKPQWELSLFLFHEESTFPQSCF